MGDGEGDGEGGRGIAGGRIGFVGDKQQVYGRLIALYTRGKKYAEALQYIERARSRALVDEPVSIANRLRRLEQLRRMTFRPLTRR